MRAVARRAQHLYRIRSLVLLLPGALLAVQAIANNFLAGPLVQVSGKQLSAASPFKDCVADEVRSQPGQNFPDSAVEPWVVVNPANPQNIVAGWQQDRWSNGGARGLVAGVSFDAGANWDTVVIPGITLCSGGVFQRASDAWLSFGPTGTLYSTSIAFNNADSPEDLGQSVVLANVSTDGGETWSAPQTLIPENPDAFNDKESITADPTDPKTVYAVWDRLESVGDRFVGPSYFTRSTDAGRSWEPAHSIFDPGSNNQTIGNQIVVLPDGTLVDVFTQIRNLPTRSTHTAALLRSTDKGATWTPRRPIKAARMFPSSLFGGGGVYDPESIDTVRTADLLPSIAVDHDRGALYLAWQDARWSNRGHFSDPTTLVDEIAFAMSTDGGKHWSKPIKINHTPTNIPLGNRQAFTPSIQVSDDGTVGVTYYDFRFNDAAPDLKTDSFIVHCLPSPTKSCTNPADWSDEIRLTASSFDVRQAPQTDAGFFVGDYQALGAAGPALLAFFAQSESAVEPADVFARWLSPFPSPVSEEATTPRGAERRMPRARALRLQ